MGVRRKTTREPWYVTAWLLLVAGFGFGVFDFYVVGALLFVASVGPFIVALRKTRPSVAGDGPATPHE